MRVGHLGLIGHDELHIARLRHLVEPLVLGEISVELFGVGFMSAIIFWWREADVVHLDLFVAPAIFRLRFGGSDNDAFGDDLVQASS